MQGVKHIHPIASRAEANPLFKKKNQGKGGINFQSSRREFLKSIAPGIRPKGKVLGNKFKNQLGQNFTSKV